jgi:nucleotide-binding universal stress UspA family protein
MSFDARPVLVAYDGSPAARAAIHAAATLLGAERLVVVSVWEPGLSMAMAPMNDLAGLSYAMPSGEEMLALDHAQRESAAAVADDGARLARGLGATAESLAMPDGASVGVALSELADTLDAVAIVVGSRGHGALKSTLLGSTSAGVLTHTWRPVLVVKERQEER